MVENIADEQASACQPIGDVEEKFSQLCDRIQVVDNLREGRNEIEELHGRVLDVAANVFD